MMMRYLYLITFLFLFAEIHAAQNFGVYDMLTEQKHNPIGIGTLSPRFSWKINAVSRNFSQSAYRILISENKAALQNNNAILFDSRKVKSSESLLQAFTGLTLKAATSYYWKVMIWDAKGKNSAWSETATFTTGLLDESDWKMAKWISFENDNPESYLVPGVHAPLVKRQIGDKVIGKYKLPVFRKEFEVKKQLSQALIFISGLGHFDLFLNGEKVGDDFLNPGWTNYSKSALYLGFDVTQSVKMQNALSVMLGNGFYNIPRERYFKQLSSFGAPKFICNLLLKYTDGTTENIVSDGSWKAKEGPITYSSIFGGEDFDARLMDDFKQIVYNAENWSSALVTENKAKLVAQTSEPVKVYQQLSPRKIYKNSKGNWIYDFGQNFSGIISIKINGKAGQTVSFRPGELLNRDSTVNQSASGSPYSFNYTCSGDSVESWQPQFSYYGFRYVEIQNAVPQGKKTEDGFPVLLELKGLHTTLSASEAGQFSCSLPMFNDIYKLIDWSVRSNLSSILTDCPHREKLGWLEVAHLMQYSMQYRYDLAGFYSKVMDDMADAQTPEGFIPSIAPEYVRFGDGFENSPEWGSAFIIIPWQVYKWYGDKSLFVRNYEKMKVYMNYLAGRANNNIIEYGLGDWFDLGPKHPGVSQLTSNGVTATAMYFYNAKIMSEMAALLGKPDDKQKFETLGKDIKVAFNQKYFSTDSLKYDRNSQTANAIALHFGLVDEKYIQAVHQNLIDDIKNRNYALTAGDIGYRYLLNVLDDFGDTDVIYKMNTKYNTPGYGFQLANGATALTESWQAYGFVSNNHAMLGHFMEWMFSGLGGVKQESNSVGFKTIVLRPQPTNDIHQARVKFNSPYGIVQSEWENNENKFSLLATIPANTSALVYLPVTDLQKIHESGIPVENNKNFQVIGQDGKYWVLKSGSGNYHFTVSK